MMKRENIENLQEILVEVLKKYHDDQLLVKLEETKF
jgi:hypothetical protein